jgi:hypothetical protein
VDESSTNVRMVSLRARAPKGQRGPYGPLLREQVAGPRTYGDEGGRGVLHSTVAAFRPSSRSPWLLRTLVDAAALGEGRMSRGWWHRRSSEELAPWAVWGCALPTIGWLVVLLFVTIVLWVVMFGGP